MASGTGGQVALYKAGSLYHSVGSANIWTDFVSESIEHQLQELEEASITGNKDAPPSHKGIDSAAGDINLEPNPDAWGHWMRATFGQSSGTLLCNAGSTGANSNAYGAGQPVFMHQFVPIQTAVDQNNFLPVYTTMVYKDTGSAFFYQGGQIHGHQIQVQAGQLVKSVATGMWRKVERFARIDAIRDMTVPKSKKFVWDMASVQAGPGVSSLAGNTNFEAININLNIPLEGVVLLDGTKNYAEFQVNEFRRAQINGTISFRSQAEYDAFVVYENRFLRLTLRNTNSLMVIGNPASAFFPTLEIDIPQFKFLSWSTPIGGPNRLITSFTGKAERDPTSAYMIEARLTNITSLY